MITTRQINVNLAKEKLKLRRATTKDIDAGVRVEPPKEPIKPRGVSTTTLPDVADIVEKKRRDDIMAERKLAMKDEKKIAITEKKKTTGEIKLPLEKAPQLIEPSEELIVTSIFPLELKETTKKKPWKLMTDDEKKIAMKERMAKVRATKARKKKEMK